MSGCQLIRTNICLLPQKMNNEKNQSFITEICDMWHLWTYISMYCIENRRWWKIDVENFHKIAQQAWVECIESLPKSFINTRNCILSGFSFKCFAAQNSLSLPVRFKPHSFNTFVLGQKKAKKTSVLYCEDQDSFPVGWSGDQIQFF